MKENNTETQFAVDRRGAAGLGNSQTNENNALSADEIAMLCAVKKQLEIDFCLRKSVHHSGGQTHGI